MRDAVGASARWTPGCAVHPLGDLRPEEHEHEIVRFV